MLMKNISRLVMTFLLLLFLVSPVWSRVILSSGPHQDSYPPPGQEIITPPPTDELPSGTIDQPYPSIQLGVDGQTPVPIGVEAGEQSPPGAVNGSTINERASGETTDRGLLFLWVGFLATLLVFLTSVVGSIILFTRRNDS